MNSGATARAARAKPAACASAGPSPAAPSPWLANPATAAAAAISASAGQPIRVRPGLARLAAQPDHEEAGREERRRDPGEDRQGARPRVRDERRREENDEQPEDRRPRLAGRDRQDRPGDGDGGDPRQGEVHVARRSGRSLTGPGSRAPGGSGCR